MASIVLWTIVGAAVGFAAAAFKYRADIKNRHDRIADLERLLGDARLDALRTQLHPHFLFNALNAISAHVEHDPRRARWALDRLGTLLRMSLEHAREQEMPLERELTFISCYMDLQKARFDDRIALVTVVAPDLQSALVPSLILQPLVENAVRHGIASGSSAGRIEIRATREANTLHLIVRDDGPGLPPDWNPAHGYGVGLSNTRERLERLYGHNQRFEITSAASDSTGPSEPRDFAAASDSTGPSEPRDIAAATDSTGPSKQRHGVQVTLVLPLRLVSPQIPPLPLRHGKGERGGRGGEEDVSSSKGVDEASTRTGAGSRDS